MNDAVNAHAGQGIYRGFIRHRRFTPVMHEFRYSIMMLMLDLDRTDSLFRPFPLLGTDRFALGWLRRKDYVGPAGISLKNHVLDEVDRELGFRPAGTVLLLTHLRYWGLSMNPISVFYCYGVDQQLEAVALQVTNTPWREKILYVLAADPGHRNQRFRFHKQMHVSPFNPMDMHYLCRLKTPREQLLVHLENHTENEKHTDATLVLRHHELTRWRLILVVVMQPTTTLKVLAGIYWNALRLWRRKVPVFNHPGSPGADIISNSPINQTQQ